MSSSGAEQTTRVQVGPLGDRRADEQAAVGAAADRTADPGVVQPSATSHSAGGVEVVEDVLLVRRACRRGATPRPPREPPRRFAIA